MSVYDEVRLFLEQKFRGIEALLPKPEVIDLGAGPVLRYRDQSAEIAILQLLARYISGLNAARLLLHQGFTQETGAFFRMLDEHFQDIVFLGMSKTTSEYPELKEDYLENFFQEEFDNPQSAFLSTQNRKTIRRQKIHSAIAHFGQANLNPSDAKQNNRTISQAYSGYVHGTSVHILEMVDGEDFQYLLTGMRGTQRQRERGSEYWNYAYRGIDAMILASKLMGTEAQVNECYQFREYFERTTNRSVDIDPEALMKKMKRP